jgi:hypothetical protein
MAVVPSGREREERLCIRFARMRAAQHKIHKTRGVNANLLDDGIGETLVSVGDGE